MYVFVCVCVCVCVANVPTARALLLLTIGVEQELPLLREAAARGAQHVVQWQPCCVGLNGVCVCVYVCMRCNCPYCPLALILLAIGVEQKLSLLCEAAARGAHHAGQRKPSCVGANANACMSAMMSVRTSFRVPIANQGLLTTTDMGQSERGSTIPAHMP